MSWSHLSPVGRVSAWRLCVAGGAGLVPLHEENGASPAPRERVARASQKPPEAAEAAAAAARVLVLLQARSVRFAKRPPATIFRQN